MVPPQISDKAKNIKLLLLDVDGVLTDGKLYFGNNGEEYKAFSTLDGQGIKSLQKTGVEVGIITGRTSELVQRRASDLGIRYVIQGREDKFSAMQELLSQQPYALSRIAFVGDDLPDLTVMTRISLAIAVSNAHSEVKKRAHWMTSSRGGEGAVREVCDLIMQAQGTYGTIIDSYIQT